MKYFCELCGTVYDEAVGDVRAGIAPGTVLVHLPEDCECPGCGCLKEALDPVRLKGNASPVQDQPKGESA